MLAAWNFEHVSVYRIFCELFACQKIYLPSSVLLNYFNQTSCCLKDRLKVRYLHRAKRKVVRTANVNMVAFRPLKRKSLLLSK